MLHKIDVELNLDEDKIIKDATNQVTAEVAKKLKREVFATSRTWGGIERTSLSDEAKEIVKEWLDENKEQLYDLISQKVATSLLRSAKFRDLVEKEGDGNV